MRIRTVFLCCLMLLVGLTGAQAADSFFSGNFTGSDSHRPQGFIYDTSDEAFWNAQGGWLDTGDGHDLITPDGYSFAVIDSPGSQNWTDYTVSCRFFMKQPGGQVVLAGRWIDRTNHYLAAVEVVQGRRIFKLTKVYRGKKTELNSQIINLQDLGLATIENGSAGTALSLSLSFIGTQITANLGGKIQLTAQDYDLLSGTAAIGEFYTQASFASLGVVAPDKPAAPAASQIASTGAGEKFYTVQLNEFGNVQDARSMASQLRLQGYIPTVLPVGNSFRVNIGRFASQDEAAKMLSQLANQQFVFAKVVELNTVPPTPSAPSVAPVASTTGEDFLAAIPEEARKSVNWQQLTPAQQRKVADAIQTEESLRTRTQSVEEIMQLKKKIDSLNETQATILNSLQQAEDQDKARTRDINRLVAKIDSAIEGQDLNTANDLLKQLERIDPASPIVILKKNKVQQLKNGTWDGYEQQKENLRKEIVKLQSEAAQSANLEEARTYWQNIIAKDPLNSEQVKKAKSEVQKIEAQIQEEHAKERADIEKKSNTKLYAGLGAVTIAVVLGLAFLYVVMRRRHARIMLHVEERAIQPLADLREKTLVLASGGAGAGSIAFGGPSLLPQTDASDAEFMIPETDSKSAMDFDTNIDDFMPDLTDTSPVTTPPPVKTQEVRVEKTPPPIPAAATADSTNDDFLLDFGDEEEQKKNKRVSTLPRSPSESTPTTAPIPVSDEISFSFDDTMPGENTSTHNGSQTEAPITAAEIPITPINNDADEIVFSFDDLTSTEAPPTQAETTAPAKAAVSASSKAEDSMYESISLDDLSLDITGSSPATAEQKTVAAATGTGSISPLSQDTDLNFDLRIDMPADSVRSLDATSPGDGLEFSDLMSDSTTPIAGSATLAGADTSTDSSNGFMFQQKFDAEPTGSTPSAWHGETSSYATLSIVDDPDGNGGRCLEFRKTKGEGPTSFARSFPDVTGRIGVEFDVRCDEKNKHLLGFYIEKDGDFRRSVHTVVQCIDVDRPAYLRIFTKPTPYTLGSWRHIKYVIDLPNGLVDGYVDNKLVAEGVRMGTKTESLNTFSIRDNTESTGVLLLNNLIIYKVPENA